MLYAAWHRSGSEPGANSRATASGKKLRGGLQVFSAHFLMQSGNREGVGAERQEISRRRSALQRAGPKQPVPRGPSLLIPLAPGKLRPRQCRGRMLGGAGPCIPHSPPINGPHSHPQILIAASELLRNGRAHHWEQPAAPSGCGQAMAGGCRASAQSPQPPAGVGVLIRMGQRASLGRGREKSTLGLPRYQGKMSGRVNRMGTFLTPARRVGATWLARTLGP